MNKLIDILRLHFESNLSQRQISKAVNISRSTVGDYINKFKQRGIPWPLEGKYLNEDTLSQALKSSYIPQKKATGIDFFEISKELRKHKNLTLQLLHSELIESGRIQGSYSNFALQYRTWLGKQPKYMRQTHKSADKVFTDYSGKKLKIIDADTGELREVEIFVGVLGASTYIYLEATWSQTLPDWVSSHVRMFEYFNGSTNLVIPDNLASGVTKADRYDPEINATYSQMLAYYGAAAMPARIYTPKDKPHAENGVLIMQRWVLAVLRNEQIYGLDALNKRLRKLMIIANTKPLKLYPEETRLKLFNELDKPYLRPLPNTPYVYREFKKARVGADYHITLDRHHYSVPYRLIGQEVDVWHTSSIVECFYKNECVAKHIRSTDPRGTTTCAEHMPRAHREYAALTVDKMSEWANKVGSSTSVIVEMILSDAPHQDIGCKRSHGFLNLSKKYSEQALESACGYALNNGIKNYKYIEVIIKHLASLLTKESESTIPLHDNIRGAEHYH